MNTSYKIAFWKTKRIWSGM